MLLVCLPQKPPPPPPRHSTPNSRPFNRLQPLCSLLPAPVLCFQSFAASFPKTPGVGVLSHPAKEANPGAAIGNRRISAAQLPCFLSHPCKPPTFIHLPTLCPISTQQL